ncbi:hypothetical protein EOA32_00820 [Mesorhizobium sp. M1A.F.Ca.ET.072.01.1.1]|uniref:hypothetical protein n=1 Tax=Mesorhizobium sp. M1A.F.Ca.ET.072.01.1.1 TaxID=2496753 RepID=UPI000FD314CD|nr:hypothetical protein [Mesorhizobium sp. M1A.F.Ca.ET.072.01.1.1]RUW55594.1 hypothetical protein EOA32_00820 [Mesorhizobium sp. M1A.F.Ca.ET.072.01.1.1]
MVVNMYFPDNADLIGWRERETVADTVKPWKPEPLGREQWPPNYAAVYAWRIKTLAQLRADKAALASARTYYKTRPAEFIMHWMDTYDPRRAATKWIPFVFFEKQYDFITFLHELRTDGESGLCEKSRDVGATWGACGYSVWSWLFIKDDAIGWGSRKQDLVDTLGDPDSIFEKLRLLIKRLPDIWLPEGLKQKEHITFMKLINPANGSVITGEAGDNIGRGGRKTMYFKDESAHYERPDKIEAALGDNTNVQVDISSVNGLGNVFHRRREAGIDWQRGRKIDPGFTRVFVVDWRDHPNKTQEWYDTRKAKYEREGLAHLFAQEVDRNYSAAISNTIIPYEWITHAVDAHLKVPYLAEYIARNGIPNVWTAGLDVADEGIDRNALSKRQWIIWRSVEEWGERDTGVTTRRAVAACRGIRGIKVQYDCVGLGASVKAEFNRLVDEKLITPDEIKMVAWNAGAAVQNPFDRIVPDDEESSTNKDIFHNMKAQAWFSLRMRFYKTFKAVTEGVVYPVDDLISLDSSMNLLHQLMKELAQPTSSPGSSLKTVVNKKPDGAKSPNLADSGVQMFFPVPDDYGQIYVGSYR